MVRFSVLTQFSLNNATKEEEQEVGKINGLTKSIY